MADDPLDLSGNGRGPYHACSEPGNSTVSSHISRPKWRRLLRAAARVLSSKLHDGAAVSRGEMAQLEAALSHVDACGGGSELDIHQCMKQLVEDLKLSDEDAGIVIVGMYHFLQTDDLPVNTKTWRALVVTSLLASVQLCLRERAGPVKDKIKTSVVHWWPREKADAAYRVFTARERYKRALLTPSVRANCYFNLRDQSLAMSGSAESSNSAVMSFDHGAVDTRRTSREAAFLTAGRRSLDTSNRSFSADTSFMLSEDSSWSPPDDVGIASI